MKILLPVDGSEGALEAVRHALRLVGKGLAAGFVLANVQEPASLYEVVVAHDADVIARISETAAENALAPAEALLRTAGVPFESEIAHGDPATRLIDLLERLGCDLVIVGARGVESFEGGALGSVASALLSNAGVPVTVVPRTAD